MGDSSSLIERFRGSVRGYFHRSPKGLPVLEKQAENGPGLISEKKPLTPFEEKTSKFEEQLNRAVKEEELPNFRNLMNGTIADYDFDVTGEGPDSSDPRYQKLEEVLELYAVRKSEFSGQPAGEWWIKELREELADKRDIVEIMRVGKFLAHAGYTDSLEQVVTSGGLMSSVARVNAGLIRRNEIVRWGGGSHPDANAIAFFPWEDNHAGIYSGGGWRAVDKRGATDMIFLYPTQSIAEHAKAVRFQKYHLHDLEVTSSPEALRKGNLVESFDDNTLLPLVDAYLVVPIYMKEKIEDILKKAAYSEEWIGQHLYFVHIQWLPKLVHQEWQDNNMQEVLREEKDNISLWLDRNCPKPQKTVKVRGIRDVSPGAAGFGYSTLYALKLEDDK